MGKAVTLRAVISSSSSAFTSPAQVSVGTPRTNGVESDVQEIPVNSRLNLELIGTSSYLQEQKLRAHLKAGDRDILATAYRTIYRVRARPPVVVLREQGAEVVDEAGQPYRSVELFIAADEQMKFKPGDVVTLRGWVMPNPKNQAITVLCGSVTIEDAVTVFDKNLIRGLMDTWKGLEVHERVDWILTNFEKFSHIDGRRDIAMGGLLVFFTPTQVELDGELQHGWGLGATIGDSTCGKTQTARKLIALLRGGVLMSAETASLVGLTGTVTQTDRDGWFVDWGMLPLCDRRLLAIDGAQKLPAREWASLAEAQRNGVIQLTKASKDSAPARVRELLIANPVDEARADGGYSVKPMSEFLHPVSSLGTVLDKTGIARLDLAVFVDNREVSAESVNRAHVEKHIPQLEVLSEVLKLAWSDRLRVKFEEDAMEHLLEESTRLYKRFGSTNVPLVSIDMKWKLARLSVSLATLTLNVDRELSNVTVTKAHVEFIVKWLSRIYAEAGLHVYSALTRVEALDVDDALAIVKRVASNVFKDESQFGKVFEICQWIALATYFQQETLASRFNLAQKNELRPLIAVLEGSEGLIRRRRGFTPTAKLTDLVKVLSALPSLPGLPTSETKGWGGSKASEGGGGSSFDSGKDGKGGKESHPRSQTPADSPNRPNPPTSCAECGGQLDPKTQLERFKDGRKVVVCAECWQSKGEPSRRPKDSEGASQ